MKDICCHLKQIRSQLWSKLKLKFCVIMKVWETKNDYCRILLILWPARKTSSCWGGLSGQSKIAFFFIAQRIIIWYFVFTFSLTFIKLWYKLHIFSFFHTQNVVGFSLWDKTFHNIWDSMLMTQIEEENHRNWLNEG